MTPSRWRSAGPGVCFTLSGSTALVFQTSWTQRLALVFGASELAVIAVLCGFMLGLAIGARAGSRWSRGAGDPLALYAALECGIAAWSFVFPSLLAGISRAQQGLFAVEHFEDLGPAAPRALFQFVATTLALLPPTLFMGASLPLLVRWTEDSGASGSVGVARLYGLNTLGAAAGAILAAYLLLPRLGLDGTTHVAAAVCLFVAALAFAMSRRRDRPPVARGDEPAAPAARVVRWPLFVAATVGAAALSLEVLWTRLFTFVLGGSLYSFAAMLATFLLAIAAGSAIAATFGRERRRAILALRVALPFAAVAMWAGLHLAAKLPSWVERLGGPRSRIPLAFALAAVAMAASAIAFGAIFSLSVRAATRGDGRFPAAAGSVLFWNTLGAVGGAAVTGLWLLPALRFPGTMRFWGLALLAAAGIAALAQERRSVRALAILAMLAAIATALVLAPEPRLGELMRSSPLSLFDAPGSESPARRAPALVTFGPIESVEVGRTATVVLHRDASELRLTSNGLPESAIQPAGSRVARYAIARWLSLLPLALRGDAESMLIVGLGAGVTIESLPSAVRTVDVVELEPAVLAANRLASPFRRKDPVADPRVRVHFGDARGVLDLARQRVDVVVSQPSHPWTSGSAALFTREFFEKVRSRLSDAGVFVQWIGTDFVDVDLTRSLLATLRDVFPYVECYFPYPHGALLFAASGRPFDGPSAIRRTIERDLTAWREIGVTSFEDFLVARVLDDRGTVELASGAPLTVDGRNLLQVRSPRLLGAPSPLPSLVHAFAPHDALRHLPDGVDPLRVVRRLLRWDDAARAARVAVEMPSADARSPAIDAIRAAGPGAAPSRPRGRADGSESENLRGERRIDALLQGRGIPREDPRDDVWTRALIEGRSGAAARDSSNWTTLDRILAAAPPDHPLAPAFVRTRAELRAAFAAPTAAREAIALLDETLAGEPLDVTGLWLRARLAARAEDTPALLASLDELTRVRGLDPARAERALELLDRSAPGSGPDGREAIRSALVAAKTSSR